MHSTYHQLLLLPLVVVCGASGLPPSVTPVQSGPHFHPYQPAQDEQPNTIIDNLLHTSKIVTYKHDDHLPKP